MENQTLQLKCLQILNQYNVNIALLKKCFEYSSDDKGCAVYNRSYEPGRYWKPQLDIHQYQLLKKVLINISGEAK